MVLINSKDAFINKKVSPFRTYTVGFDIFTKEDYNALAECYEDSTVVVYDKKGYIKSVKDGLYYNNFKVKFYFESSSYYYFDRDLFNKLQKADCYRIHKIDNGYKHVIFFDSLLAYIHKLDFEKIYFFDKYDFKTESQINKKKDDNSAKRGGDEYNEWLKSVLTRDKSTCQCCGSTLNPQVHHIKNYRQYKNLRTEITNGITLCE